MKAKPKKKINMKRITPNQKNNTDTKLEDAIVQKRDEVIRIAAKHGAGNLRIFGSIARGESDHLSDIDILVDMEPEKSLLDLAGLLVELRKTLGVKVDVFTEGSLKPRVRERALKESVPL